METGTSQDITADFRKTANRVSLVSLALNIGLSLLKLLSGIISGSGAMISDAIHSASDVFSTIIVMIGVTAASKKADAGHAYGHERFESIASVILAVILAETGIAIGWGGISVIIGGNYGKIEAPGLPALIAAVVSVALKEWMYHYTKKAAKRINSDALMADAWHHRSDALSSVGAFVGILGARLGLPILDSYASVLISVFIIKAAVDIFRDAAGKMVDKSCDDETVEKIRAVILSREGVRGIDELKTRLFGSRIYVDVEIRADSELSLRVSHGIAEDVHSSIEKEFPSIKHCMVHVNPDE